MFAGLPKLADRNFVIGFLLPTLLGTIAFVSLFRDAALVTSIYDAIWKEKSFSALTILLIAVWTGSTLLLIGNHALYRVLEGYTGPFNRPKWRAKMQHQFEEERQYLTNAQAQKVRPEEDRDYIRRYQVFTESFPTEPRLVLPTRFGNIIRAFETYPLKVYGVDAIPAWYRLEAIIPKDFQAKSADALAEANFFVNLWLLSLLFALSALLRFLFSLYHGLSHEHKLAVSWGFLIATGVAILLACISYWWALDLVKSWGGTVKAAFDLYLPALAKRLGYRLPASRIDRERFWDAVNSMFLYRVPMDPEKWPLEGAISGAGDGVAHALRDNDSGNEPNEEDNEVHDAEENSENDEGEK